MSALDKPPAASWSSHALLTYFALKSFHHPCLQERIIVTDMSNFLQCAKSELSSLILWYWNLLSKRVGAACHIEHPVDDVETVADLLAVLQLNSGTRLHYVRLQAPEEVDLDSPHDPSREGPPGSLYLGTPTGTELTPYEILFTYSDEPDWGMDQDLFELENHRYGAPPFGITSGISSQGPFHMAFLHENPILTWTLPALTKSFLPERVRVFSALADLAFSARDNYWGWRFTSWAMHYLQDVTAPYHARAFPPALTATLRQLLARADGRNWSSKIRDILKIHHILFEAVMHLLLNEAVKKRWNTPFSSALTCEGYWPEGFRLPTENYDWSLDLDLGDVIEASSMTAAGLASKIDVALMALFPGLGTNDRCDSPGTDFLESSFDILRRLAEERTDLFTRFLDLTSRCLAVTGRVTRFVVRRMCRLHSDPGDVLD